MTHGLLTPAMVNQAIDLWKPSFDAMVASGMLKRPDFHIVVMNPAIPYDPSGTIRSEDAILVERSLTDPSGWEGPFDKIARAKARASWRTGLPTRVIRECYPHLLREGDTAFGGSYVVNGLVVAGSGVQPWIDEASSGMVAHLIIGLANEYMQAEVIGGGLKFIQ